MYGGYRIIFFGTYLLNSRVQGRAALPDAGASSGLHHDFHDNLYVLLRGRKRFRLYPPHDAARTMYTYGRIAKVHKNGCIVYAAQVSFCPEKELCFCV